MHVGVLAGIRYLLMSLLVDLNLNRSPFARRRFVTATEATDGFELRTEYHSENLAEKHTLEERRAFLGCIYLASVYGYHQVCFRYKND